MPINLITDSWIPVRTGDGTRVIRPDQMSEPGIGMPSWPRADLNIACLELLIGLVYLADPPSDVSDWRNRRSPDPTRLRDALLRYAAAFDLGGPKERFMQDLDTLDDKGTLNPPDMLFIDSAGDSTAKKNADIFVRRSRYPTLPPELAAMAIYTLQSQAPSGGSGNRTSMRGGGPLVSLIKPNDSLWDTIWANVPYGSPQKTNVLPWTRPTNTSEKNQPTVPPSNNDGISAEVFFGMPRRLRLVFKGDVVTGVIQRPHGHLYFGWRHPLSPYYQVKAGDEFLAMHPKPGAFGYRQWLGVVIQGKQDDLKHQAQTISNCRERFLHNNDVSLSDHPSVLVAGWSMDNMKPREYVEAHTPIPFLSESAELRLRGMIKAADMFSDMLRHALKPVLAASGVNVTALAALHELFFTRTEPIFEQILKRLEIEDDPNQVAYSWLTEIRHVAMRIFDDYAKPGLSNRSMKEVKKITKARRILLSQFAGNGKGMDAFECMELDPEDCPAYANGDES